MALLQVLTFSARKGRVRSLCSVVLAENREAGIANNRSLPD
jgi:hypothetical protein